MIEDNNPNINLGNTNFDNIKSEESQVQAENLTTGYNPPPSNEEMNYANFQEENTTDYKKIVLIALLSLFLISGTAFGAYKIFFSKKEIVQPLLDEEQEEDEASDEEVLFEEDIDKAEADKAPEAGTQSTPVTTPAVSTPKEEIKAPAIPTPDKTGSVEING